MFMQAFPLLYRHILSAQKSTFSEMNALGSGLVEMLQKVRNGWLQAL